MTAQRHNHVTRDVKPPGVCPACDLIYAASRPERQAEADRLAKLAPVVDRRRATCGHAGPRGATCTEDPGHEGVTHGDGTGLRWVTGYAPRLWSAAQPTSDDVAECAVCGRTIFRTNIDGRWHHPGPEVDHPATPQEDPRA